MLSMLQAAKLAGTSKASIHRAIKAGRLSAGRREDGTYAIDPSELARVYPIRIETAQPERSETGSEPVAETPSTAALEVEVKMLRELLAQMREERDGLRQDRDAWRGQAERLALTDGSTGRLGGLWGWLKRAAG